MSPRAVGRQGATERMARAAGPAGGGARSRRRDRLSRRPAGRRGCKPRSCRSAGGAAQPLRRASETLMQETDQLSRRADQIRAQIRGIAAQRAALVEQRDLVQAELVNVQDLIDRGSSETSRGLTLRRESARLLGSIGELDASTAEAEGRITEIEMSILQLETQRREEAIAAIARGARATGRTVRTCANAEAGNWTGWTFARPSPGWSTGWPSPARARWCRRRNRSCRLCRRTARW